YRGLNHGTEAIKNYLVNGNNVRGGVYKEDGKKHPYVKLLQDFDVRRGEPGAALRLKAADFAYLRDLGIYPLNRMCILRRFPDGAFLHENLEEMSCEPIATCIGWVKADQNFGDISFNETWDTTDNRLDQMIKKMANGLTGGNDTELIPIPSFAQGMLFEFYKKASLTGTEEEGNSYTGIESGGDSSDWGLMNIPIGDPNVLKEGPYRPSESQNIKSDFTFELESTYEQKMLGDIDPGSAMLDIIDNLLAIGTSNMKFYFSENSPTIVEARKAVSGKANDVDAWWSFVVTILESFWDAMSILFQDVKEKTKETINTIIDGGIKAAGGSILADMKTLMKTILTSTVAIHRYELRGSIELMTGGKLSSTPWHLTIGNPYSPWLSTNHIIVKSATIVTSTEMGFNEQPKYLTVKFNCALSRSLGKQEILRMFNNTYRRNYTSTPPKSEPSLFDSDPKQNNVKDNPANVELLPMSNKKPLVSDMIQSGDNLINKINK
ncbi:hypothetical protein M0Q97_13345, partial [Candidatus Dojkabacteria bacterium]|nr:hypothetical protein [Candidatus Dojkabacteria bacterium]